MNGYLVFENVGYGDRSERGDTRTLGSELDSEGRDESEASEDSDMLNLFLEDSRSAAHRLSRIAPKVLQCEMIRMSCSRPCSIRNSIR